jgi:hypothetical protein
MVVVVPDAVVGATVVGETVVTATVVGGVVAATVVGGVVVVDVVGATVVTTTVGGAVVTTTGGTSLIDIVPLAGEVETGPDGVAVIVNVSVGSTRLSVLARIVTVALVEPAGITTEAADKAP